MSRITPTADELKVLADQLVKDSVEYVITPNEENMAKARFSRLTLHAGFALVFQELKRLQDATQ